MPTNEDIPNLAMEDPLPPLMIVLWLHLLMECFIHLRLWKRLSHCPLGNNLLTHGQHGEQFQKIIRNSFSSILRSKCAHAKKNKNRASEKGGCMQTGGSISLQDHTIRLSDELGRSAYVGEIFQQTHLRKDIGQFVDDRSRQTHEEFEARLSQARSNAASSVGESKITPLDLAKEQRLRTWCWVAATGPKRKGCLYGTGEILLILINVEMTTSCSIHKDLPVALKIHRSLTEGRSFVNQRRRCVYFSQLFFNFYLLKRGTIFINFNNLTSSIRNINNNKTMINQMTSNQMTNNKTMTNRDTLPMNILIIDITTQSYY
ncbi:hypothetical protein GmHk_09G025964 [Glycine max]|nr:hypothetical protein GmHk_09G025964 [Glycine max]